VKRVVEETEKWKVGDKTQISGMKVTKQFGGKKIRADKNEMIGATVEWKKKDRIPYVDKPITVQGRWWWLGYAGTGWPKGKQDRRRVTRKTDTWLSLWGSNREGDTVPEVRQNQRMKQAFSFIGQ
jgi:hypothetical protein